MSPGSLKRTVEPSLSGINNYKGNKGFEWANSFPRAAASVALDWAITWLPLRSAGRPSQRSHIAAALLVFLTLAHPALAKHPAPAPVGAVTNKGVRYVVPNDNGLRAYVEAWDPQSGKKLWAKTIIRHYYIPPFGNECMHYEYLKAVTLQGGTLILTSDRGRTFSLDTRTKRVRRVKDRNPG